LRNSSHYKPSFKFLYIFSFLLAMVFTGCTNFIETQELLPATQIPATQVPTATMLTPTAKPSATVQTITEEIGQDISDTPVIKYIVNTNTPVPPTITPYATFTITPSPTNSPTPTPGPRPWLTRIPSLTPTTTRTPSPPDATIRIQHPGQNSKVISPIRIEAMISPGEDRFVYLYLIGEDGRIINSDDLNYSQSTYTRFLIAPYLSFQIESVAEAARLLVVTKDNFGRTMALSSVDLILLTVGRNEITPVNHLNEHLVLSTPIDGQVISGGKVVVTGQAAPLNESPLIFELIDENSQVVGSRKVNMPMPAAGLSYTSFVIDVSYSITGITPVRLVMRQESDNGITGTIALSSCSIILKP
jgi:hypothetical protein